jgi:hypothetical protein
MRIERPLNGNPDARTTDSSWPDGADQIRSPSLQVQEPDVGAPRRTGAGQFNVASLIDGDAADRVPADAVGSDLWYSDYVRSAFGYFATFDRYLSGHNVLTSFFSPIDHERLSWNLQEKGGSKMGSHYE